MTFVGSFANIVLMFLQCFIDVEMSQEVGDQVYLHEIYGFIHWGKVNRKVSGNSNDILERS